jgi:RND family efflux transporter MFP subunit
MIRTKMMVLLGYRLNGAAAPRFWTICFLIAAAAWAASGVSQAGAAGAPPPAPQVIVSHPLRESVPRWDEFTGRFEPVQQVELRARVSGVLDKINFVDGQMVKAGDVLFVIDQRPYQIAVDSASSEVARIQAQVTQSGRDFARAQQLTNNQTITLRDADQRRANADVARAQLAGAQAALRNAELNLEWTQVRAPISGRVSDRRIDVGNLVQGGQAGATLLTTIVTLDPIHFVFDASEADFFRFIRGAGIDRKAAAPDSKAPVLVRLADETEWTHRGIMNFVDNQLNPRSGTIRGRAVFDNKDLFLSPGSFGRLRLFSGDMAAFLVPDSAISSDQTNKIVFTVSPERKIEPKRVTLGPLFKGLRVVLSGLEASDLVAVGGLANPMVRPGALVDPKEDAIRTVSN